MKTVLGVQRETYPIVSEPAAFRLGDVDVLPVSGMVRGPEGQQKLDPKVMDVLMCLVSAGGEVQSKEELMSKVWGEIIVTDFALSRCIYQLRKTLGQVSRQTDSPILTLPDRGYRLAWQKGEAEHRPEFEKNRLRLFLLLALAIILAIIGIIAWYQNADSPASAAQSSIAVLSFDDLTAEAASMTCGELVLPGHLGYYASLEIQ